MSAVSEIMSAKKIISLKAESDPSILDATRLMLRNKIGSIVMVNREDRPVGILTERDVLRKALTARKMLSEIKAKDVMSSPVITIKAFDSVEAAASVMTKKKIKRLVVLEQDGSMAGVISLSDITKKLAKILTDEHDRFSSLKILLEH